MYVKYVGVEDLYSEPHAFTEAQIFNYSRQLAESQEAFVSSFFSEIRSEFKLNGLSKLYFCEDRYRRVVIDTLFDIKRIKSFHHIDVPNRIKMTAYTVYWWIQRKPLVIPNAHHFLADLPTEFTNDPRIDKLGLRMTNINELFCAHYIMSEIFNTEKSTVHLSEDALARYKQEYNTVLDYLYYFLCYRLSSPKSIELFIMGLLMHPIWEIRDGYNLLVSDE